jgi:hypothetical protein
VILGVPFVVHDHQAQAIRPDARLALKRSGIGGRFIDNGGSPLFKVRVHDARARGQARQFGRRLKKRPLAL